MKPTLKTTALAMCIALSLAACKSTSNSGDARPTPVQPEAAKEATTKAEAAAKEAAAKAEAAAAKAKEAEAAAKAKEAEAAAAKAKEAEATKSAASSYDALNKLFYKALVDDKSSDLVDATYKGKVFAKVKIDTNDEELKAPTTIDEDGDVTLNVKNSSDKFKMSGTIDSKTVGRIELGEEEIIKSEVKNGHVEFSDDEMEGGKYSATISKNGDIVGRVDYDSKKYSMDNGYYPRVQGKDGATKNLFHYEAFFDATKQPK